MILDAQILAACIQSRRVFEGIKDHVKVRDFSPQIGFWYNELDKYYKQDAGVSSCNKELLRNIGLSSISNPKQSEALLAAFDALPSDISPANIAGYVLDMRRRNLILELAAHSSNRDDRKRDQVFEELQSLWGRDTLDSSGTQQYEYAKDWDELGRILSRDNRISLGIPSLDSRINGGVLPGHHILIFGRTEIGKSCLTVTLSANLLKNNSQKILYCGNEDKIDVLKGRMGQSILGWTSTQVETMPRKYSRLLREAVGDRLTMVGVRPGSISELEELTEKHTPTVLVVDQIRNLVGAEDGMTRNLESNAIRFRSLLNQRGLIGVSVTQAGDRSQGHNQDGPLYLSAGDVDSSRVGLPGTVDLMLGIGANQDLMRRGLRMISFAKNKLSSETNSREPILVKFDLQRNQVRDE